MEQKYNSLVQLINNMKTDIDKFNAGVNAAGGRIRKSCQEIKSLAQEMRKDVQEQRNANKTPKE